MGFLTVNNVTLHYTLEGPQTGLPLVFINSLGTDLHLWDALLPHLPPQYRRVRYDKRGHGLSDAPPGPYTLRDHTEDLTALLDALGIEEAVLIGISVGGQIAMDCALQHPGRVRGLVLCSTAARIGSPESWSERMQAVRVQGLPALAPKLAERWFSPGFAADRPDEFRGFENMLRRTPVEGYLGACAALRDADLREAVKGISVPTLVICGGSDVSIPVGQARELAESIPGARLQVLPGAGHQSCVEQPQDLAEIIRQFLETLATPSGPDGRYEQGMCVRRAVLGDAHVDRAEAAKTPFDADFQRFIVETAWGAVWTRPGLDLKTRHLLTITLLAALGKEHELGMHLRATRNTGLTPSEVKEALMQVAVYAGVPAANSAFALAKKIYEENDE